MSAASFFTVVLTAEAIALAAIVAIVVVYRLLASWRGHLARGVEERAAAALRGWLFGGAGPGAFTEALVDVPTHVAMRHLATAMAKHIPPEHSDELAAALREAGWVRRIRNEATSRLWRRRLRSARLLAHVATRDDRAVVERLLHDKHAVVRIAATRALPRVNDRDLVSLLVDRLPAEPPLVGAYLAVTLRDVLPYAVPVLLERLARQESASTLSAWVNVAEVLGVPEMYPALRELSEHASSDVRLAVARALKHQFNAAVPDILARYLEDPDWRVRTQAARSLGHLGAHEKVPRLVAALGDPSWWVRFRASLALAQMGESGRRALRQTRRSTDRMARDMASLVCGLSDGSLIELTEA
ncbi:MAG: HEAT repeat domain-containing protein [Gemmatimonadaceae bacterium]